MPKKDEYLFTAEVKDQVESFREHMEKQPIDTSTLRQKSNYAGYFLKWLETEQSQPGNARYTDLLSFIDYCRHQDISTNHINRILASVRDYYKFLKTGQPEIVNPAANLYLKGTRQKVISGIIDFKELEILYQAYSTSNNRTKRNKIILGLFIYQAVNTEELRKLETTDIKLKEGKIHIPGVRRRNSRMLVLKSFQVMELHEYLTEIRPQIVAEITSPKPARKPDKINTERIENQLFISINGSENIKNSLLHLFRDVQKIHPGIINAGQIRQSTITYWLKHYNLRVVQYMAGHKYVSSTERYQNSNLENLKSKLDKLHPLANQTVFNL